MKREILSRPVFTGLLALALLASLGLPVNAGPQGELGPNGAVVMRQELGSVSGPAPHFSFGSLLAQVTSIVKTVLSVGGTPTGTVTNAGALPGQLVTFLIDITSDPNQGNVTVVDRLGPGLNFQPSDNCTQVNSATVAGVLLQPEGGTLVSCNLTTGNDLFLNAIVSPNATVGSTLTNTAFAQLTTPQIGGLTQSQATITVLGQATATATGTLTLTPTQTATPVTVVPAGQTTLTFTNPSQQTLTLVIPTQGGGSTTLTVPPGTSTFTISGTVDPNRQVTVNGVNAGTLGTSGTFTLTGAGVTLTVTVTPGVTTVTPGVTVCINQGSVDIFGGNSGFGGFGGFGGGTLGNLFFNGNTITGNMGGGGFGPGSVIVVTVPTTTGTQTIPLTGSFNGTFTGTFTGSIQQGGVVNVTINGQTLGSGTIRCDVLITDGFNQFGNQFLPPPPLQFLPPPPPPLLPPPPPAPMGGMGQQPAFPAGGIPIIPEADSLFLLVGGLAALGGLVGFRSLRRRQDDDAA